MLNGNAIISARDLSKTFDGQTFALKGVNVDILPGQFVAVIGLSGAGKSTFLRSVNGMITPSSGTLSVLESSVEGLDRKGLVNLRRQIGFVFQQFNLVKNLTVLQNVLTGRIAYAPRWRGLTGLFGKEDLEMATRTLDSVGLRDRYTEKVRNLSGGQQQRVAIARALVQQPKILLADEPMASLDPKLSEVVLELLSKANKELGITVLVNIHVLELAKKYAGRILGFRHGQLVFDGKPSDLTEEVLESVYQVDPEKEH